MLSLLCVLSAFGVAAHSQQNRPQPPEKASSVSSHADVVTEKRLAMPEAQQLVAAWVKSHQPHQAWAWRKHPFLKDITPKDGWKRLGTQVFKQRDIDADLSDTDAFLIKDRNVYPLSMGLGGWGLTSLCVCDLNQDGKPELAYTYSWGSGIHRSHLAVFCLDQSPPAKIETPFVYRDTDLLLERQDDQTVRVYVSEFVPDKKEVKGILLGRLTLSQKDKHPFLDVVFEPDLPKEWRDRIWKVKP